MPEFLLEIGCEEIPASWLARLEQELAAELEKAAAAAALAPKLIESASTPRRLIACLEVLSQQGDRETQVFGPSVKAAKDAAGAWTPAALGFAKKNDVRLEDLLEGVKEGAKPGEKNLLVIQKIAGRPALEILPNVMAHALRALSFPKRMNWDAWLDDGKGAFQFGRPIRWIVALLDREVVPFRIYEMVDGARGPVAVESGRATRGHRFLGPAKGAAIEVASFRELSDALMANRVVPSRALRRERIRGQLRELGVPHAVSPATEEWPDLVEHPAVVAGRIPPEFSSLPVEVRNTVLAHHQKYEPFADASGALRFAAVTDTDGANAEAIVRGMERVVVARLRDARFFYGEDSSRPLSSFTERLSGITFFQGLGTYQDKAERMKAFVARIQSMGLLSEDELSAASSAALFAKADLATLMVGEFPELQGTMGSIYLANEGVRPEVIHAVRCHYVGVPGDDGRGNAKVTAMISLADKLDTLAAHFGVGNVPSGSRDPYGLRRAGQEAVRALVEYWPAGGKRPSLRSLMAAAVDGTAAQAKRPHADVALELEAFLLERLRFVLVSTEGAAADEVDAVLAARDPEALDDPKECVPRLEALHRVRSQKPADFEALAAAFKRINNILKQANYARPWEHDGAFTEDAERNLQKALAQARAVSGDYEEKLEALAGLRPLVDTFFDKVMVMAEDPAARRRRLGLLGDLVEPFFQIADISKLGGQA